MTKLDTITANKVIERDQWCLFCGNPYTLTPHHIVPIGWQLTRHDLDNIITLCMDCHDKLHRTAGKKAEIYYWLGIDELARFKESGYW